MPVWDPNIPYTLHGQDRTVKITQETSITFYTPNLGLQGGVTIPTSGVTYDFYSREGESLFQSDHNSLTKRRNRLQAVPASTIRLGTTPKRWFRPPSAGKEIPQRRAVDKVGEHKTLAGPA